MNTPYFFHVETHPDASEGGGTLVITTDPVDATEVGSSVTLRLEAWGSLVSQIYSAIGESRPGEVEYLVKCMLDYRSKAE